MAALTLSIDALEIGRLEDLQSGLSGELILTATDGTNITAQVGREAAQLLEMVWASVCYGADGDDDEQTLSDLRRVAADRAERRARRMAA